MRTALDSEGAGVEVGSERGGRRPWVAIRLLSESFGNRENDEHQASIGVRRI
ncbi:hypothetical protein [Acanthopleuribacter pedis]|uniref:Uncharacterized protein n=1 Tax=Acanthopleuribacter pedis TaxID=442870 RepID=A0A8J7Q898_9BACT|nr:hypothetical protein [Acanthopleuribacter pedis]MBO1319527.1 hypothetical protein [Acanthopleuribacter pedis]